MTTETMPFRHRFVEATPLARGAEGRLFRVRDQWTGRWAALKVASDATARESLLSEFRLLSRLRHPCLLESQDLLDDGAERGHLLEYLPALDPTTLWDAGGEEAVWAAALQSLRALTYLHRQGLVHGDVAPGNILVWREGSEWRAKLADLGLALPFDEAARAGVRGTPGYWAPETATGTGTFPSSDLYSLGATLFAWIEGRGPWDGLSPAEQLRRIVAAPDLPKPRRRISPELEALVSALGASRIEARRGWDWAELRSRSAAWGPSTIVATVSGLEEPVRDWTAWVHDLPGGQVASLVLSGRIGTGRRTAAWALVRELVGRGWMTIGTSPLGVLHDRFGETGKDLDPVLAARELGQRCQDRHLVFLWPERAGDLESRILRAFVAAREDASSELRTLIIRATGIDVTDEVVDWLRASTRCRTEEWTGPGFDAMRSIATDLFPAEEGTPRRGISESAQSPLALVLLKQGEIHGTQGAVTAGEELETEIGRLWDRMRPEAREALALLAESDLAWKPEELGEVLGWSREEALAILNELSRLRLMRRSFEQGVEADEIADLVTRKAVLLRIESGTSSYPIARVRGALEAHSFHPNDLGLALRLLRRSEFLARYTIQALDTALREGRYEEVLEFAQVASGMRASFGVDAREAWSRFLRAAQRVGRYEVEARLLRELIEWTEGEQAVAYRKSLGQALTHLGDWKHALEECERIEAAPEANEKDRLWAKLQRAETLWQAGRFDEADATYAEVESRLSNTMIDEWLRYGVGRARQHGQRGDMVGVKRFLDLAEVKAGKERCEKEPMYLHTLGGLLIEKAELESARPLLHDAAQKATESSDWAAYVMIASREASLTYDFGEMRNAARLGREGVATAEALASRRILGFTNSFLGYPETHLGNVGPAWRRTQRVLELAHMLGDRNLEVLAYRLRVFIASSLGWRKLTEEASLKVHELGSAIGEREAMAFATLCLGLFKFASGEWDEAKECLLTARREFGDIGQLTSELKARIYLALIDHEEGKTGQAVEALRKVVDESFSQKVVLLNPIARLSLLKVTLKADQDLKDTAEILLDFEAKGRYLDFIEWGTFGLPHPLLGNQIRGYMLNAVQRTANSLDDVQLRREFLGFPRTRKTLLAIQG